MAETLYIRIGSQAEDNIHWLIKSSADEEIIASGELANASELTALTQKAHTRAVTVFVPACDVVLKSLMVPSKSARAMRLAVPYMLEEELAQDVEQLFFAYAEVNTASSTEEISNNCHTAAVDRGLMQEWLQWLSDADIHCNKMLPDVLAMPLIENGCSAIVLDEQIIIRQSAWQGMTIDFPAWPVVSRQLINRMQNSDVQSEANVNTDELNDFSFCAYSSLPCGASELNIQTMPEELPLALLAEHGQKQSFNLRQGEFQYKEKRSPVVANWLWAAGFAVFALLLTVGAKGSKLLQLTAQIETVEQQIVSSYKSAFPNTQKVRINTVKSQLKRQISQAGGGDNQAGFLSMLSKIRPAFSAVPELKPESLKFDGKRQEIRIQAVASDYQHFEKFKNEVLKTKLSVNQGAQNNQGDEVSGSFSISENANSQRSAQGGRS